MVMNHDQSTGKKTQWIESHNCDCIWSRDSHMLEQKELNKASKFAAQWDATSPLYVLHKKLELQAYVHHV